MSLTTNNIINLARNKLLEAGTEIITEETILIYANLAQEDIVKKAFPNGSIETASITLTNGIGTLPDDFGTLYGDAYDNNNGVYPELSIADFSRNTLNGLTNAVTIENGTIKVTPTTTASINIKYYKVYPSLTSAVNPEIEPFLQEMIVYGILFRAYEDLQDESLSKYYKDKYDTELQLKLNTLSNYEEGNQRGGQMFNGIQIVSDGGINNSPNYF